MNETEQKIAEKKRFSIVARIKNTTHAFRGLGIFIKTTHNLWLHIFFAILAVHMYGRMCPMPEIMIFAKNNNLKVIEDCAQSHFAEIQGKKAGTYGDIGAFSFYPTKNLGALGDAGAIICDSEEVYLKITPRFIWLKN